MPADPHWEIGQAITFRGVWHQKLWWAGPSRVVSDSTDLLALYWQAGTISKQPRQRMAMLTPSRIDFVDHVWRETDVLALYVPGEGHSIWAMWETSTPELRCWYINLEMPWQRTSIGFDTMDYLLDIVISPDRSSWHWKDEEEFEQILRAGVFTAAEGQAIREEGWRAIRKLEENQPPFCDGWDHWRSPSNWSIPELAEDWDKLE